MSEFNNLTAEDHQTTKALWHEASGTVRLQAIRIAALEARYRELAELLARCSGELHNYHSVAGDELLDAINDALSAAAP